MLIVSIPGERAKKKHGPANTKGKHEVSGVAGIYGAQGTLI